MTSGLVSVIIPTRNRANLVVQAIDSVFAQTWTNIQIIVVDDGSSDSTLDVLSKIEGIEIVTQHHRGQAAARNRGLQQAKGEFICTLDSDDLWQPRFVEETVSALIELRADFVFANWHGETRNSARYPSYFQQLFAPENLGTSTNGRWRMIESLEARTLFLEACLCPSSGIMFRRESICHGWIDGLNIADDWCLLLDIVLSRPARVAFTMDPLWVKRVFGDNIYDDRDPIQIFRSFYYSDYWFMFRRHCPLLTFAERAKASRRLALNSISLMKMELSRGNKRAAVSCAYNAGIALFSAFASSPVEFLTKLPNALPGMCVPAKMQRSSTVARVPTLAK